MLNMDAQNLNAILLQVDKLDKAEQAILLKRITKMITKNSSSLGSISLTQLSGLGSSIWRGLDIDKYIDDERQW